MFRYNLMISREITRNLQYYTKSTFQSYSNIFAVSKLFIVKVISFIVCFHFLTKLETEAVVQRCSVKKVFLKISQNSQENTCARVSFLKILWNFLEHLFYRTPPVPAFVETFLLGIWIWILFKQSLGLFST